MANKDVNASQTSEYPQGSSALYAFGTSPNTRTAISQKVRILTPTSANRNVKSQIGVLGSFNVSMSRNAEPVRGIGFGDKIAELVPNVQDPVQISWERALLYMSNIFQAVGYHGGVDGTVRSLAHHRWPFDIKEELVFSEIMSGLSTGDITGAKQADNNREVPIASGSGYEAVTAAPTGGHTSVPGSTNKAFNREALITVYEACWITSVSRSITKDQSIIMENGDFQVTDVHAGSAVAYNDLYTHGGNVSMSGRYSRDITPQLN